MTQIKGGGTSLKGLNDRVLYVDRPLSQIEMSSQIVRNFGLKYNTYPVSLRNDLGIRGLNNREIAWSAGRTRVIEGTDANVFPYIVNQNRDGVYNSTGSNISVSDNGTTSCKVTQSTGQTAPGATYADGWCYVHSDVTQLRAQRYQLRSNTTTGTSGTHYKFGYGIVVYRDGYRRGASQLLVEGFDQGNGVTRSWTVTVPTSNRYVMFYSSAWASGTNTCEVSFQDWRMDVV